MPGADQVEALEGGRARQRLAGEIAPAAAEVGDVPGEIVGQVAGEEGGTIVDAVPAEDAGAAQPRAVSHGLQASEAAPVGRRLSVSLGEPTHPAVELRQRAGKT